MGKFKKYRRIGHDEMRPYVPGEDLTGIFVNEKDVPKLGGMIARNPQDHADQWYMSAEYFGKFEEINRSEDGMGYIEQKFGYDMLDDVRDWVANNIEPEDLYDEDKLVAWAEVNGFEKKAE